MTHFKAAFAGDFLTAAELGGREATITISGMEAVKFAKEEGGSDGKWAASVKERPGRKFAVNVTNANLIAAMFGDQIEGWIGKRVTLHSEKVRFGGQVTDAIRVMGSPDLDGDVTATVKLPRKKPVQVRLVKTGNGKRSPGSTPPDQGPDEDYDGRGAE